MNRFEQMLQKVRGTKSVQQHLADVARRDPRVPREKSIMFDIIDECHLISDTAQAAAMTFAQAGSQDMVPEVYQKRCEVLEYLKLVNYGLSEFFKNTEMPEVLENGDQ